MQRATRYLATALCALMGPLAAGAEAAPRDTAAPLAPGSDLVRPALEPGAAIPGELLVGFRRNAEGADRSAARRQAGVQVERALRIAGVQLVTVGRGRSTREAITRLEADPAVRYAEPNRVRRASATVPNDPAFGQLWGLNNAADSDIDAPEAWDLSTGGDALVAVVDEGVAYDHPDLAPNVWTNPGETPGNGVDDDGNGYVDDIHGIDTVDGDSDPRDFGGHGTHVAGTIAAAGNNGIGITGVSWDAQVMAVRALGPDGGSDAMVAEAFDYAADMGARVVNASLGSPGESQTLRQPITDHPDTLFVVAAGNGGDDGIGDDNDGAQADYPCAYPDPNLICVAATTQSDGLAGFSNFGATTVDLGAPGTNVLSAAPDRGKVVFSDTFETDDFAARWLPNGFPAAAPDWSRGSGGAGGSGFSASDSPGSYANSAQTYMDLITPVDLSAEHGCELTFDVKLALLAGDRFGVFTSFDGGANWDTIGATAQTGASTDGAFAPMSLGLGADGEASVIISFGIVSNATGTADGASVDNIRVVCVQPEQGDGELAFSSGTSMATPHVAGAAALLFSRRPRLTVEQAKAVLLSTGDPIPSLGAGKTVTGRRLNLDAALRHPTVTPPPQPPADPATGVSQPAAPTATAPPDTGSAPAPVDTLAKLVSTTRAKCKRARRAVTCTITAEGAGAVKLQLRKRGRTLARGSGRLGRAIRLSRRVKAGRYQLRVAITDSASGRSQTIAKTVKVR